MFCNYLKKGWFDRVRMKARLVTRRHEVKAVVGGQSKVASPVKRSKVNDITNYLYCEIRIIVIHIELVSSLLIKLGRTHDGNSLRQHELI